MRLLYIPRLESQIRKNSPTYLLPSITRILRKINTFTIGLKNNSNILVLTRKDISLFVFYLKNILKNKLVEMKIFI
ncbi:MAG: hypothetical protein IPM32_00250 [Ignavibacteriae bacterium]|nr:hypothetical protein [Ignavibacteriota bacterium]